jgi:hypothetical protein
VPFIVSSGTGVVCDSLSDSVVAVDAGRTGQLFVTVCSVWPGRPGASVVAVGAVAAMSGPTTLGGAVVVCTCGENKARARVCVCV